MKSIPAAIAAILLSAGSASAQITIQIETNAQVEVTGPSSSGVTTRSFTFPGGSARMFMLGGGGPSDDIMAQMDEMIQRMHEEMGLTDPFLIVPGIPQPGVHPTNESGAYLGILPGMISDDLRDHLGLDGGAIIEEVMQGSPAENAGLQPRDILLSVDDKVVDTPYALSEIISEYKPGDEVTLKILRRSKEMTIKIALAEHPVAPAQPGRPGRGRGFWNRAPQHIAPAPSGAGTGSFSSSFSTSSRNMSMSNDRGWFSFSEVDGDKTFTAKDKAGNVIFQGPVNTDEEKEKVPEEVRDMLEQLDSGNGSNFRINIQPGGPALPPPLPPAPGRHQQKGGVSI